MGYTDPLWKLFSRCTQCLIVSALFANVNLVTIRLLVNADAFLVAKSGSIRPCLWADGLAASCLSQFSAYQIGFFNPKPPVTPATPTLYTESPLALRFFLARNRVFLPLFSTIAPSERSKNLRL